MRLRLRIVPSFVLPVLLTAGAAFFCVEVTGCKKTPDAVADVPADFDPGEPKQAQGTLPTIKVWLGQEQIEAEQAVTMDQVRTGMMFRKTMGTNDGMLFVLPYTQQTAFWMKNCFVPLSVAYIDPEGVIEEIHDLQPQNTNSVVAQSTNIRFALEMPQGWYQRHQVSTGMVVRTESGSLMQTYGIAP
jgi:uncharacterized membrane protein (UPF0127 family)